MRVVYFVLCMLWCHCLHAASPSAIGELERLARLDLGVATGTLTYVFPTEDDRVLITFGDEGSIVTEVRWYTIGVQSRRKGTVVTHNITAEFYIILDKEIGLLGSWEMPIANKRDRPRARSKHEGERVFTEIVLDALRYLRRLRETV